MSIVSFAVSICFLVLTSFTLHSKLCSAMVLSQSMNQGISYDSIPAEFASFVQAESANLFCWAPSVFAPYKPMCLCIQFAQGI